MYSSEEKLCLKWNDFQENVISEFGKLRNDQDFTDVTLACEDGEQVEAHKVILAASSPFFQNLLRRNKHPHPLIYMRGVRSEDLVAIIGFIYNGETNVYQENLVNFLSIADELSLKGLTGVESKRRPEETDMKHNIHKTEDKKASLKGQHTIHKKEEIYTFEEVTENEEHFNNLDSTAMRTTFKFSGELHELDAKVKSMMTKSQSTISNILRICTICGKEAASNVIKGHIEANHLEGISIPCDFCDKIFRTRHSVDVHKRRNHRNSC